MALAARWFALGAAEGFGAAQYALAVLHEHRLIEGANAVEAFAWYSLAAAQSVEGARASADRVAASLEAGQREQADARISTFVARDIKLSASPSTR